MAAPGFSLKLEAELESQDIQYEVMIEDVQRVVELEKVPAVLSESQNPRHSMSWTEYHTLDDIYSYLDYLEQTFDFVSTETVGQSGEGRDMRVAKVCMGGCGGKKAVWIGEVCRVSEHDTEMGERPTFDNYIYKTAVSMPESGLARPPSPGC